MDQEALQMMDKRADQIIARWTFGGFAANILPPPFDAVAVASVFATMGAQISKIYGVPVSVPVLTSIGRSLAKGISSVGMAATVATGLFKYVPGVSTFVAFWIQPPIVAAISYSVGKAFKQYCHFHLTQGRDLTPDEVREIAEAALRERLGR